MLLSTGTHPPLTRKRLRPTAAPPSTYPARPARSRVPRRLVAAAATAALALTGLAGSAVPA